MAYWGSGGTWLRRWRAACRLNDVECLLALLIEDRESGKTNIETLKPVDISVAASVAWEFCELDLLRQLIGMVEEGVCGRRGMFDSYFVKACEGGHVGMVRELLSLSGGAAVNVHEGFGDDAEYGFLLACERGHVGVVCELLALTGDREVDVHAAYRGEPEGAFRRACAERHARVMRELLGLTGHRAIPLQTRLDAGQLAVQPAKDAVWAGTSTRRGRCDMVLLRAGARR